MAEVEQIATELFKGWLSADQGKVTYEGMTDTAKVFVRVATTLKIESMKQAKPLQDFVLHQTEPTWEEDERKARMSLRSQALDIIGKASAIRKCSLPEMTTSSSPEEYFEAIRQTADQILIVATSMLKDPALAKQQPLSGGQA